MSVYRFLLVEPILRRLLCSFSISNLVEFRATFSLNASFAVAWLFNRCACNFKFKNIYRPHSRGDNTFGSVHVCVRVCMSVRLSVGTLLFEPCDL